MLEELKQLAKHTSEYRDYLETWASHAPEAAAIPEVQQALEALSYTTTRTANIAKRLSSQEG